MKKFLTLSVFILALFVLAVSVFLFYSKQKIANPAQTSNKLTLPEIFQRRAKADLFLSPASATVQAGESLSVDIKVRASDLTMTTASIKLTLKYDRQLPLQPKSQKVTVNPELVKVGWSYLFNQVKVDDKNKNLSIDLLMANLEPGGYKLNQEILLGTLEFISQSGSSSADFEFDPSLTKIQDENNNSLKLNLGGAQYTIQ